jgi:hypothetical protein
MKPNLIDWYAGQITAISVLAKRIALSVGAHPDGQEVASELDQIEYACNRAENLLRTKGATER